MFSQIPFLSNIWIFSILLLIIYLPLTIAVGHYHNRKQLGTDIVMQTECNPFIMEIIERLDRIEKTQGINKK
jgi:hypothetical protein